MISVEKLSQLISSPESSTLDFKSRMYNFDNDQNSKQIGSFVKDILAFTNTIRSESAFIIIGVEEIEDFKKNIIGIDKIIDDAILQEKIKNKVYPMPRFSFYTMKFDDKNIGILEFPVFNYSLPVAATQKLKGIELGQVYHRKGSSNSPATSIETIYINDWLKSISINQQSTFVSIKDNISEYVKRISKKEELLSSIVSELFDKARQEKIKSLEEFCKNELLGLTALKNEELVDKSMIEFKYRVIKVYQSLYQIDFGYSDLARIKKELEHSDKVHNVEIIFNFPLFKIEEYLENYKNSKSGIFTQSVDFHMLFPEKPENKGIMIYRYILPESFHQLYIQISQRLIEELLNL